MTGWFEILNQPHLPSYHELRSLFSKKKLQPLHRCSLDLFYVYDFMYVYIARAYTLELGRYRYLESVSVFSIFVAIFSYRFGIRFRYFEIPRYSVSVFLKYWLKITNFWYPTSIWHPFEGDPYRNFPFEKLEWWGHFVKFVYRHG